jgi:GT2 family glycosyltransferase
MKAISIILVTYNSGKFIESCLDSIFSQDFKDYEVIAVDNSSTDKTKSIIGTKYSNIILVENTENFGPCKARNQGIAKANGRFILCLDHDVKLLDNFLKNIYKAVESQDNIGAVGPKILMADAKTIYSTGIYPSYLWRFHDIGSGRIDEGEFGDGKDVFGISAAAAIYRRAALEEIRQGKEYFDEDFFYFFEDVDVSWRLQKKGWRILYIPEAVCLHKSGRSRNRDGVSRYLCMRNRYLLLIKNVTLFGLLRLFIVFFIYDLWRNLFILVINSRYFLKASSGVLKLTPQMVRKRLNLYN